MAQIPKVLKNPSVVLLCKASFKIFLLVTMIVFVILFFVLLFDIIAYFLTKIGAILVFLFLFYKLTWAFIYIAAFPGSFWFWRREVENNFSQEFSKKLAQRNTVVLKILKQHQLAPLRDVVDLNCLTNSISSFRTCVEENLVIFERLE